MESSNLKKSEPIKELYEDYGWKLPFLTILIVLLIPFRLTAEAIVLLLTWVLKASEWFLKVTEI